MDLEIVDSESFLDNEKKTLLQLCTQLLRDTASLDETTRVSLVHEMSNIFQRLPKSKTSTKVRPKPAPSSSSPSQLIPYMSRANAGMEKWFNLVHLSEAAA
jgi:hypothetical protein